MIILSREKDKDMFIKFAEEHNKKVSKIITELENTQGTFPTCFYIEQIKNLYIGSVGNNKWDIFIKYKGDFD